MGEIVLKAKMICKSYFSGEDKLKVLNNFSNALGVTEKIPLLVSVWAPVIILSLFCSVGVMQINEK